MVSFLMSSVTSARHCSQAGETEQQRRHGFEWLPVLIQWGDELVGGAGKTQPSPGGRGLQGAVLSGFKFRLWLGLGAKDALPCAERADGIKSPVS